MKSLSSRLTLPGRWLAPLMLVLFALALVSALGRAGG